MLDIVLALAVLFLGIAVLLTGRKVINVMTTNTQALEELRAEIEQNESATESVLTLINGLNNRLTAALAGDESNLVDEITALRDELDANNVKLATAATENTGAAEDSDSFHDPAPIGEEAETGNQDETAGSEPTADSGSSEGTGDSESAPPSDVVADESDATEDAAQDDTSAGVDEDTAAASEEVTGDTGGLPTGDVFADDGGADSGASAEESAPESGEGESDPA